MISMKNEKCKMKNIGAARKSGLNFFAKKGISTSYSSKADGDHSDFTTRPESTVIVCLLSTFISFIPNISSSSFPYSTTNSPFIQKAKTRLLTMRSGRNKSDSLTLSSSYSNKSNPLWSITWVRKIESFWMIHVQTGAPFFLKFSQLKGNCSGSLSYSNISMGRKSRVGNRP